MISGLKGSDVSETEVSGTVVVTGSSLVRKALFQSEANEEPVTVVEEDGLVTEMAIGESEGELYGGDGFGPVRAHWGKCQN